MLRHKAHEISTSSHEIIVPETTLTSQSYTPCIAMIAVPGQRPIVCLNSAVHLKKLSERRPFRIGMLPKYISPEIGKQLRALTTDKLEEYAFTLGAGTHAEVRAVNKYFKAHGHTALETSSTPNIDLRIVRVQPSDRLERGTKTSLKEFPKCKHCAAILDNVQLGVHWVPKIGPSSSAVSTETTDIAVSTKESIRAAVSEMGFEIVDSRLSATSPRQASDPRPTPDSGDSGKRPRRGSTSRRVKPRSGRK